VVVCGGFPADGPRVDAVIWMIAGLALAFTVLGLILDRRSLVASSLLYFTAALTYAAYQSGAGLTVIFAAVPLAIGLLVIVLGLAWNPLRDLVLRVVPFARWFRPPSEELDRFIIGQKDAKRAVAVALRNRWRRQQVDEDFRGEILPKNILMIGPTGVGKTEISRRLAKLADAPFTKVEATKFTEVGYVGRDVEQIVRDLLESAISMVRDKRRLELRPQAHRRTVGRSGNRVGTRRHL